MIHADILVTSQIKILFLLKKNNNSFDHFQLKWLEAISSVFRVVIILYQCLKYLIRLLV